MARCLMCASLIGDPNMRNHLSNMGSELITAIESQIGHDTEDGELCEECFNHTLTSVVTNNRERPLLQDSHVCIWCRSSLFKRRSHAIPESPQRIVISEQISPRMISEGALVCYPCWVRASRIASSQNLEFVETTSPVNTNICIICETSVSTRRSHGIPIGPERNYIVTAIYPREITPNARVCWACWRRAQRNSCVNFRIANNQLIDFDNDFDSENTAQQVPDLSTEEVVHPQVKCNECQAQIFGYVCVQCADWDLCGGCEAAGAHKQHYVLRLPGPRPQEKVKALIYAIQKQLETLFDDAEALKKIDEINVESDIHIKEEITDMEEAYEISIAPVHEITQFTVTKMEENLDLAIASILPDKEITPTTIDQNNMKFVSCPTKLSPQPTTSTYNPNIPMVDDPPNQQPPYIILAPRHKAAILKKSSKSHSASIKEVKSAKKEEKTSPTSKKLTTFKKRKKKQ